MFYELIYTRCRQGMDITRKGQQISSDGYKVYSCTPAIMEEGKADLQFLMNSAQAKQPYTDPDFMDDAYLYYVPDSGKSFLINFHPIHFDADAKGDYAHRPGNFVNHAILGDFSTFYPYKMFQDDNIWNAKTKGEAFYYENSPAELPERNINDPAGQYKLEEINAFIADGRKEALTKAVAFLIAQYNEEPEKRKFLLIKDDSSKNIELWIAAIECAFSPQIASVIPFATRMDKFANANKYTVKNGIYQPQMNLQDPNHKHRYRAMIVGVDERDKTNINASRPMANSPFVLLDGKQKQIAFEGDTSNKYYQLITKFDDEHKKFCQEFLQTFCDLEPNASIYNLYEIFTVLNKPSLPDTRTLANALDRLNKYNAANTVVFKDIYNRVNTDISRFLREDFSLALSIINWLLTASGVVGDTGAKQNLTGTVCNAFKDIIFSKTDNNTKLSYWKQIQSTGFKTDAARVISDIKIINDNSSNFNAFSPADAAVFLSIYLDSNLLIGNTDQKDLEKIVRGVVKICYRNNDQNSLHEIVSNLLRFNINSQKILFELIKGNDKQLGEFVIKYIIDHDNSILASDNSMWAFYEKLKNEELEDLAGSVLIKRIDKMNKPSEMEVFIKTVHDKKINNETVLTKVFESIDAKNETPNNKLVELLQTQKSQGAKCKNSAHFFALNVISNNRRKQNLKEELKDLINQGFPSITNEDYIDKFVDCLIKASLTEEDYIFILEILFKAPKEYLSAYTKKIVLVAAKNKDEWNDLFKYALQNGGKQVFDVISQSLAESKQNEKALTALGSLLKDQNILKYYNDVVNEVKSIILSKKK